MRKEKKKRSGIDAGKEISKSRLLKKQKNGLPGIAGRRRRFLLWKIRNLRQLVWGELAVIPAEVSNQLRPISRAAESPREGQKGGGREELWSRARRRRM